MPEQSPATGRLMKELTQDDSLIPKIYKLTAIARRTASPDYTLTDAIFAARSLQNQILATIGEPVDQNRTYDLEAVKELEQQLAQPDGTQIMMRHGQQYVDGEDRQEIVGLVDPYKKIALMKPYHNVHDPASIQSLAEAAAFGLVISTISREAQMPVVVKTSPNRRAAQVAAVISISNGFNLSTDNRLTCVNYPDDVDNEDLAAMLKHVGGALVWDRQLVDDVCGKLTYINTTAQTISFLTEQRKKGEITIAVTHSPQTFVADQLAGEKPGRMQELGFRLFNANGSIKFAQNIFR